MAEGGDQRVGTVLGATYRLDRLLAGGGCGDVYVATHLRLGSEVDMATPTGLDDRR